MVNIISILNWQDTTHDHKHNPILTDSGGPGLCVISQSRHQSLEVVGDGGAKHRSVATPSTWHSVADPHAVATIHPGGLDPTVRSFWAYGVYSHTKASYFGKDFLRMAGIVQMLHVHKPPYDKYPYAHRERTRQARQTRNQEGSQASMAAAIP